MAVGNVDTFVFKRYKRADLIASLSSGSRASINPDTFPLPTNPVSTTYATPRLLSKQPTILKGRFIVQDHGPDVQTIQVKTQTGNILRQVTAEELRRLQQPNINEVLELQEKQIAEMAADALRDLRSSQITIEGLADLNYFEILTVSTVYKAFDAIDTMYRAFDADEDILTLEYGNIAHRGMLTNFEYTVESTTPWNWPYAFAFWSWATNKNIAKRKFNSDLVIGDTER